MPHHFTLAPIWRPLALTALLLLGASPALPLAAQQQRTPAASLPLTARVVAVGIPGVGAISPVGTFLPAGIQELAPAPIPTRFPTYTLPHAVLDPSRILVASQANFGAVLAHPDEQPGAALSIDPSGPDALDIPATFAQAGGQAATLSGRVQLFAAQSPAFQNGLNDAGAVTAAAPAVSNPLGISLNNAFGRVWFANAPAGVAGPGTSTVIDPTGRPLANPPNTQAGGVFAGAITNRQPQVIPGDLSRGAVGTALLGPSPDGTGKAVFAVVTADGGLAQVHVGKGVDGLAPTGTISPLPQAGPGQGNGDARPDRLGITWDGMCLFVTDPVANQLVILMLAADPPGPAAVFRVQSVQHLTLPAGVLATPVDAAPTHPETTNPRIASNTTLAEGSDVYVANRANNTIARLEPETGTVVAVRQVVFAGKPQAASWHLNGIAVAPDGQRIWATMTGQVPGSPAVRDAVLELPAF